MKTVISNDGTAIAFDRLGDGPAVILVGGAFQHRAIDPRTAELAGLLAERFTVVHYDRRGRGDSGDTQPYAVEREIEDLDALIREVGGPVYVFGMSSGAVLALAAAAHGLPIAKLALYEPPFIVDDSRSPVPADYSARLRELASTGRRGEAVEYFLAHAVGVPVEVINQMRHAPVWPAFEAVAHTLAYDAAVMGDTMSGKPLPTDRWSAVTAPTLALDGGASPGWARAAVVALTEALRNARRETLDGQTHEVAPEVLAPVLIRFFAG